MNPGLVFEIGAEELPASAIAPALAQMKAEAEAFFAQQRLAHAAVRAEGTPRRLALMVAGLQGRQEDHSEEFQGPSAKAAFGPGGEPTAVALGFARGKGVELADLEVRDTPKGPYVFARARRAGRLTHELLEEWLPGLPGRLNFAKSMRWGDGGPLRFARPISWLCALYGTRALRFSVGHLDSAPVTRGHRFLAPRPIRLADASDYEARLAAADVVLSFGERRRLLLEALEAAAAPHGRLVADPELADVVANLLEKPRVVSGSFDPSYLALPKAVVVKVLREHQYAFAVERPDGSLAPRFLATTNGVEDRGGAIAEGNARVVRARLEDALFFYREDQKVPLEARREDLKSVVWLEKLGSVHGRVERLEPLAAWVAERLAPAARSDAARAARLCKSDLVTLMVGEKEFTSLQGEMGGVYAGLGGESPAVCAAIAEHYRPRYAGDRPPATPAGRCVALADKIDELVGAFGVGLVPTGSQDPYALRRKASGIVAMLKGPGPALPLDELIEAAIQRYPALPAPGALEAPAPALAAQVLEFLRVRLETALAEEGYGAELVAAVAASRGNRVAEAFQRAAALREVMARPGFASAVQAFSRVTNILDKAPDARAVRPELLEEGPERVLWERYLAARPVVERHSAKADFVAAFDALAALQGPIDAFFADVLVMADDPAVRANRLSLLAQMARTMGLIADFRKLVKRQG